MYSFSIYKLTAAFYSASLARSLPDNLLEKATLEVVKFLGNKVKPEVTRTNIQMLGALW